MKDNPEALKCLLPHYVGLVLTRCASVQSSYHDRLEPLDRLLSLFPAGVVTPEALETRIEASQRAREELQVDEQHNVKLSPKDQWIFEEAHLLNQRRVSSRLLANIGTAEAATSLRLSPGTHDPSKDPSEKFPVIFNGANIAFYLEILGSPKDYLVEDQHQISQQIVRHYLNELPRTLDENQLIINALRDYSDFSLFSLSDYHGNSSLFPSEYDMHLRLVALFAWACARCVNAEIMSMEEAIETYHSLDPRTFHLKTNHSSKVYHSLDPRTSHLKDSYDSFKFFRTWFLGSLEEDARLSSLSRTFKEGNEVQAPCGGDQWRGFKDLPMDDVLETFDLFGVRAQRRPLNFEAVRQLESLAVYIEEAHAQLKGHDLPNEAQIKATFGALRSALLQHAQAALDALGLERDLETALEGRFPNRTHLLTAFKGLEIAEEATNKIVDCVADEWTPKLLRHALLIWLTSYDQRWLKGQGATPCAWIIDKAFEAYAAQPGVLARALLKAVEGAAAVNFGARREALEIEDKGAKASIARHLKQITERRLRAALIALGRLREEVGGRTPKLLAHLRKQEELSRGVREAASKQHKLFNRQNLNRGRHRKAERRAREALTALRRADTLPEIRI